jgi:hypothetical protein
MSVRLPALAVLCWLSGCAEEPAGTLGGRGNHPQTSSPGAGGAFENLTAGTSCGPEGRTNIRGFDFEDGLLPLSEEAGALFVVSPRHELSLTRGGAGGSAFCLSLSAKEGSHEEDASRQGLRLDLEHPAAAGASPAARANSHAIKVKAFAALEGEGSAGLVIGSSSKTENGAPGDAFHSLFESRIECDGSWRELLVRSNRSRDAKDTGQLAGPEPFLDGFELWPESGAAYWELVAGDPEGAPREVHIDDILWFYENPFLAAFPHHATRWAEPGGVAEHPVVVWNTHPRRTRSFALHAAGGLPPGFDWASEAAVVNAAGEPARGTGPLAPGQGFAFFVRVPVPEALPDGSAHAEGSACRVLVSVFEEAAELDGGERGRLASSAHGIGIVLETLVTASLANHPVFEPPPIGNFRTTAVGGSWADLAWTAPAAGSPIAYAIRVGTTPILDEAAWQAAVPLESIPGAGKAGAARTYTLKGLRFDTHYHAAIRCFNENGAGSALAGVSFFTGSGSAERQEPPPEALASSPLDPPVASLPRDFEPPVIRSVEPPSSSLELAVGERVTFSVAAFDPEGRPVTAVWALDGVRQPESGLAWSFHPGLEDVGVRRVLVEVSAGADTGASRLVWEAVVVEPPAPAPTPAPAPSPEPAPPSGESRTFHVAPAGSDSHRGTSSEPFRTFGRALEAAQPGDIIVAADGTYGEAIATRRAGAPGRPITLRAARSGRAVLTASGRVVTVGHAYFVIEGLVLDGQFGENDIVRVYSGADGLVLRGVEVRNGARDGIDMGSLRDVLIEGCRIHHLLWWDSETGAQQDAHGVTGAGVVNLTIRGSEIYQVSGDAIQLSPNRVFWDNLLVEDCHFWSAPLPAPVAGFPAGFIPGENAFDTKSPRDGGPRPRAVFRRSTANGWRGAITHASAFNIKENVDVTIEQVTVFDSEIAFRLRHPALVTVRNAVIRDNSRAIRYEDGIAGLKIHNNTFARNGKTFDNVGGVSLDVRNNLFLGASKPVEAGHASNRTAPESDFIAPERGDYRLTATSGAIDAGVPIEGVTADRDGVARPQGRGFDAGAYEYSAAEAPPENAAPEISAATPPPGAVRLVAGETLTFSVVVSDPDGDRLSALWTLDGAAQPGSGLSWSYRPLETHIGKHQVSVGLFDGHVRAGGVPTLTWEVTVEAPPLRAVTLAWDAPIAKADGTNLSGLAGYKLYHGTESRRYTRAIDAALSTRLEVGGLAPGRHFFSVTAYDEAGNESAHSEEVEKELE